MCTEFAKGIALGMIAGAAVGAVSTSSRKVATPPAMPKKRVSAAGKLLKTAGHVMENISDALGL